MRLLYAACLHLPEDFERWLLPYLRKRCTVYPYDYRIAETRLSETARILDVDHVFVAKGECIPANEIDLLRENGIKSSCWTIDDHAHPEYYKAQYDVIFTPSPGLIPKYHENGFDRVYELPFYVDPEYFLALERDDCAVDSCLATMEEVNFLGTRYDGREGKITHLRNAGTAVALFGDQWKIPNSGRLEQYKSCVQLWARSKINLNIHQPTMRDVGALNTKVYEIPAAGGFMITDYF